MDGQDLSLGYAYRVGFPSSRCDSSLFIYQHGSKEFDMTDLGALNYFLGISVTRDSTSMFLSQKKYALKLLHRAHMANCNPTRTPVGTEFKHGSDGDPISDLTLYRSLGGGLQYLTFLVHISLMQCNRFAFICMILESLI
ncbi:ribonuclease H-like domain-containing protein, partial [Tanacetum coccineum]